MFYHIRTRIGVSYILLVLAVLIGLSFYIIRFVEDRSVEDLEARLGDQATLIAQLAAPIMTGDPDPALVDALAHQVGSETQSRVTIIDQDGVVLGESVEDRATMDNHASRPEFVQARLNGIGSSIRFSQTAKTDMFYLAVPVTDQGKTLGFVRVALSLEAVDQKVAHLRNTLLSAAIAAALLAGLLAVLISSKVTRPLRELIAASDQMAEGRLENHLIPTTHDEIGQLTQTFNEMAHQLNARIADLEAERSRVGAVLSVMTDGVIIVDSDNRVQSINPAAVDIFELDLEKTQGKSLFELVRHHKLAEILDRSRETSESQSATLEVGGKRLYIQATATPLGSAQPGNMLVLFQNLTRLRRLETIRQDFISNISHELRTPLASLKALTETLNDTALEDPPAARHFLQQMDTEIDALTQLVEELLELSRIESGRVPLKLEPVSPFTLIEQAVQRLKMQAERAQLKIFIECPPDLPPFPADPNRLEQVIVNLLHNAIKFTSVGGEVHIAAQQTKTSILFSVQDNGQGIASADLPRIFERFYKTDRARSGGGTGLGLAISRRLVEAHGGTIWAESLEGKGSTFYFSIPLAGKEITRNNQ